MRYSSSFFFRLSEISKKKMIKKDDIHLVMVFSNLKEITLKKKRIIKIVQLAAINRPVSDFLYKFHSFNKMIKKKINKNDFMYIN